MDGDDEGRWMEMTRGGGWNVVGVVCLARCIEYSPECSPTPPPTAEVVCCIIGDEPHSPPKDAFF